MAAAIVKVYSTTASKLGQLQVADGQLIFVKDTKKIYLDMNGVRIEYSTIQVFNTDADRRAILAPIEGFYYVEDTAMMWRYKSKWIQITPDNLDPFFFGDIEDFPVQGNPKMLYIADDATYKWDAALQEYVMVANKTVWDNLGE